MKAAGMALVMLALGTVWTSPARAQRGLALEVRGGASAGNYAGAASDIELAPEPSFGAGASFGFTDALGVYAGYSRSTIRCESGFCVERGVRFTSQGVEAGVQLQLPVFAAPWVRAGVVRHSLAYDSQPVQGAASDGEETSGTGFSAGGGVELRLGRRLSLTPGVRYLRYGGGDDGGVAVVVGDVGFRIRLGA